MGHISEMELGRFMDYTLPFVKKVFVKWHLNRCPECRGQLEQLCLEKKEFEGMVALIRRLDEADRKSTRTTRQTVTSVFQSHEMQ